MLLFRLFLLLQLLLLLLLLLVVQLLLLVQMTSTFATRCDLVGSTESVAIRISWGGHSATLLVVVEVVGEVICP